MLLEKSGADEYRYGQWSIPAHGLLLNRLRHYPNPMALTSGDFETWLRWAKLFRPEHTAELERLGENGTRMAVPLRTKNEIVGVLLLGAPEGRESFTAAEKQVLSSAAEIFALMIENGRLNDRALEQEKLRRDLALAAEVQRRLLPPRAAALRQSPRWRPSRCRRGRSAAITTTFSRCRVNGSGSPSRMSRAKASPRRCSCRSSRRRCG